MAYEPCELAWAAGFIDADGTITIKRMVGKPRKGHPTPNIQHSSLVQVGQRDYPQNRKALERLQAMFGGYINTYQSKLSGTMWTWGVVSSKAYECLLKIQPHLVVKKPNADLVIDFHKNKKFFKGGSYDPTTVEEMEWRERTWHQVRNLNHKGVLGKVNQDGFIKLLTQL